MRLDRDLPFTLPPSEPLLGFADGERKGVHEVATERRTIE
jgi:hypothetical protein